MSTAHTISFAEIEEFVRRHQRIPASTLITPETQFERDLGITGDDGSELLVDAETYFNVSFDTDAHTSEDIFKLADNEFLFHGEGVVWPSSIFSRYTVRSFSVGELHEAISKLQAEKEGSNRP